MKPRRLHSATILSIVTTSLGSSGMGGDPRGSLPRARDAVAAVACADVRMRPPRNDRRCNTDR